MPGNLVINENPREQDQALAKGIKLPQIGSNSGKEVLKLNKKRHAIFRHEA